MSSPQTTTNELAAVAEAIRAHERFLLTTHENPDGDALGSLLAMKLTLEQLGKDTYMYLHGEAPLPAEYAFMELDDIHRQLPADSAERILIALDCANETRLGPDPAVLQLAPLLINIDHHYDNTCFGDLNLIDATASSTGELLRDLIAQLGVAITP